jgi:hypothetical protein
MWEEPDWAKKEEIEDDSEKVKNLKRASDSLDTAFILFFLDFFKD